MHDALDRLERASAALLRLLHEATRRRVLWGEAAVAQTAVAQTAVAVRAVASIRRAAEGAVGGRERAVGWTVVLLDRPRGDGRCYTRQGRGNR